MIETELWASFVSLLRSYAAAANLNQREPVRVEEAGQTVAVAAGEVRIEMRFDPIGGQVTWEKRGAGAETTGGFEFLPEGTISIAEKVRELDQVAIEFITSVVHSGKGSTR